MATSDTASSARVDVTFARELANKMLEAWNSHNTDALLAVMTDDVVYDDASWHKQMHGRGDVREFLDSTWRAIPDLKFEFEDVLINADTAQIANHWRATATQSGMWDPPGLAPTRRSIKFEGLFLGEVHDGKLGRIHVAYDVADIMRQLGVLPGRGSRGERAIITLTNLGTRLRRR